MTEEPDKISLLALNRLIKEGIQQLFPRNVWVVAEISDCNTNQSGHCYLELIEKSEGYEQIIAKVRATIWSFTFRILKPYFESTTGQRFGAGLKVLVQASIEFHELFGFSLNIKDIDPSYTVGDLARRKQEIINRLISEGVFDLNKELSINAPGNRIAVISSETAAGYGDFKNQLKNNPRGFKFYTVLFNAFMQGDDTEKSIIQSLEKIYNLQEHFDLVVIIRGGGSKAELNYFNNYNIAFHITQFPLPVFTGIGHERDETIADLVAHTSLKTPTAVAEHIISIMDDHATQLEELREQIVSYTSHRLEECRSNIENLGNSLLSHVKWNLVRAQNRQKMAFTLFHQKLKTILPARQSRIIQLEDKLKSSLKYNIHHQESKLRHFEHAILPAMKMRFKAEKKRLEGMEAMVKVLDPYHILRRGYSITYQNGKLLKSVKSVMPDDNIETRLADGIISSKVNPEN